MIYTGDNNHRNKTFKLCIDTLKKTKGLDVRFGFCEADTRTLSVGIVYKGQNFARTFYGEDLVNATGKAATVKDNINFEKLTDVQYLNLCKYIIKNLGFTLRIYDI